MRTSLIFGASIAIACAVPSVTGQTPERSNYNWNINSNWVSRGGSTPATANSYLGRFDWEMTRGLPLIRGARVMLYDFNTSTPDTFKAVIHYETAEDSHKPNPAADFASGVLPVKNGETLVSFSRPVAPPPAGRDFWVGPQFQQGGASSDGGYVYILRGDSATATGSIELPGSGIKKTGNAPVDSRYAFWEATATGPGTPGLSGLARTVFAEPLHLDTDIPSGVGIVQHNQSTQTNPILAGFNSAAYPDINGTNPNRADDFGYRVEGAMAKNRPVAFVLATRYFPLKNKGIPFTSSTFWLDPGSAIFVVALVADATGAAQVLVPNAAAKGTQNVTLYWQGVVIGPNGELWATPSARQRWL